MLETKQISVFFGSLNEYEQFNLEWTSACAKLNPTERNVERLGVLKKRAERLGT